MRAPKGRASRALMLLGVGLATGFWSSQAAAQTTNPTDGSARESDSDEIVVTASRRSEPLLKAPLAVSAINQEGLDEAGIKDVETLSTAVPTLQIGVINQNIVLSLRGISTNNVTALGNSSVAFYTNGVYVPRPSGASQLLYDVERVEVLRGPQGTLFGRNATAGAVNVITATPKDTFEAAGDVSVGNYNAFSARGFINAPLTDDFFVRLSYVQERNDGYQDTRGTQSEDYFRADNYGLRLSGLWNVTPSLTWRPTVSFLRDTGAPPMLVPVVPSDNFGIWSRPASFEGYEDKDLYDFNSRLEWRPFDSLTLSYIAGFGREDSLTQIARGGPANLTRWLQRTKNYSHELVVNYDTDRLNAVGGLYYFHESPLGALTSSTSPATEIQFYYDREGSIELEAEAVFGQLTYALTDRLSLTGGLRYSHDKAVLAREPIYFCGINSPISEGAPGCFFLADIGGPMNRNSWSRTNWKVTVDYDLGPNLMAFANVSTGYKTGGLAANGAPMFGPEDVINYELGLKGRIFDGALSFAIDAYVMEYTDQQVSSVRPVGLTNQLVTANAASSTISGVEVEWTWNATPNDRLLGYVAYLDATYDEFKNAVDGFVSATALVDVSGNRMVRAPEFSGRLSYAHTFALGGGGRIEPQISVYAQTEEFLREFNLPTDRQDGYVKLDGTLRFDAPDDKWYAEGFVYNATDEDIRNTVAAAGVGVLFAGYAAPRTYGLRIGVRY